MRTPPCTWCSSPPRLPLKTRCTPLRRRGGLSSKETVKLMRTEGLLGQLVVWHQHNRNWPRHWTSPSRGNACPPLSEGLSVALPLLGPVTSGVSKSCQFCVDLRRVQIKHWVHLLPHLLEIVPLWPKVPLHKFLPDQGPSASFLHSCRLFNLAPPPWPTGSPCPRP